MKRFLAIIGAVLMLTGCMSTPELKERALVQGVGIDRKEEKWLVTLRIYDPASPAHEEETVTTSEGISLEEALEKAALTQGKELFCGQNKLLLIGEEVFENGIEEALELFAQGRGMRPDSCVAAASPTAQSLLSGKRNATELSQKLAFSAEKTGSEYTELMEIISAETEKKPITMPLYMATEDGLVIEKQDWKP